MPGCSAALCGGSSGCGLLVLQAQGAKKEIPKLLEFTEGSVGNGVRGDGFALFRVLDDCGLFRAMSVGGPQCKSGCVKAL